MRTLLFTRSPTLGEFLAVPSPLIGEAYVKTYGKAVLACALVACLSSTAMANPVNYQKDLVGRKICWVTSDLPSYCGNACVNSSATTYYAGNKFYNTAWGNGSFVGRHSTTEKGDFDIDLEKLADGTFKATVHQHGHQIEYTGKYCD
jgi:hypothetical protein